VAYIKLFAAMSFYGLVFWLMWWYLFSVAYT